MIVNIHLEPEPVFDYLKVSTKNRRPRFLGRSPVLCIVLAVLGFAMSIETMAATSENLVENPGFEVGDFQAGEVNILPGWRVRYGKDDSINYALDTTIAKSGERSLRITISSVRQQVAKLSPTRLYAVEAGCRVTVSLTIARKRAEQAPNRRFGSNCTDSQRKEMATSAAKRTRLAATEEWKRAVVDFQVPDDDPEGYYVGFFFRQINPGSLC